MATLVSLALENKIDIPYYLLKSDEVVLTIKSGKVLDDRMVWIFKSFDAYITKKTYGHDLTESQKTVLAYLIKSELENRVMRYTINVSPDNNHFNDLSILKQYGLVEELADTDVIQTGHLADPVFLKDSYAPELFEIFGEIYTSLHSEIAKPVLNTVYRFNHFSSTTYPNARQVAYYIWAGQGNSLAIKEFDDFNRRVRYFIEKMSKTGILEKKGKGYAIVSIMGSTVQNDLFSKS